MLETCKGGETARGCAARKEGRREKAKFSERRKEERERVREREGSGLLCRGTAYRGLENALFRLHSHRLRMGVSRA